ncbi:MAG: HEAT repeat domain-containing protein [Planctomycetaceae bacterium]|nr:HEAT repeat domain-containing protein [Planctomycetaceae bacterium]
MCSSGLSIAQNVPGGQQEVRAAGFGLRKRGITLLLIVVSASGCGSQEAPPAASESTADKSPSSVDASSEKSPPAAEVQPAAVGQPAIEESSEAVSSPPQVDPPLPEADPAAKAAFESLTAAGVSAEDMEAAIEKLLEIGPPAVPVLVEGLQSSNELERELAAMILAQFGDNAAAATDPLIASLQDSSEFVRANAATALAQIEGQSKHVAPVFGALLDSEDENLQRMAVMNLSVLEIEPVKPLALKLSKALAIEDRDVRLAILDLLARIGSDAQETADAIRAIVTTDDAELHSAVDAALKQITPDAK